MVDASAPCVRSLSPGRALPRARRAHAAIAHSARRRSRYRRGPARRVRAARGVGPSRTVGALPRARARVRAASIPDAVFAYRVRRGAAGAAALRRAAAHPRLRLARRTRSRAASATSFVAHRARTTAATVVACAAASPMHLASSDTAVDLMRRRCPRRFGAGRRAMPASRRRRAGTRAITRRTRRRRRGARPAGAARARSDARSCRSIDGRSESPGESVEPSGDRLVGFRAAASCRREFRSDGLRRPRRLRLAERAGDRANRDGYGKYLAETHRRRPSAATCIAREAARGPARAADMPMALRAAEVHGRQPMPPCEPVVGAARPTGDPATCAAAARRAPGRSRAQSNRALRCRPRAHRPTHDDPASRCRERWSRRDRVSRRIDARVRRAAPARRRRGATAKSEARSAGCGQRRVRDDLAVDRDRRRADAAGAGLHGRLLGHRR